MKSIIEQYYYNEIIPCELPAPTSKKYRSKQEELIKIEEEILSIAPECIDKLNEYKDLMHVISSMESANDFRRGFRFGARFMIDVLHHDEAEEGQK